MVTQDHSYDMTGTRRQKVNTDVGDRQFTTHSIL